VGGVGCRVTGMQWKEGGAVDRPYVRQVSDFYRSLYSCVDYTVVINWREEGGGGGGGGGGGSKSRR